MVIFHSYVKLPEGNTKNSVNYIWVCLKMGYIPNEIAFFHRDNDQQNHWLQWGTQHFQTHPYVTLYYCKYAYSYD